MITSTITVVLVSSGVFGLMTKPLIRILLPHPKLTVSMSRADSSTPKSVTVPLLGAAQDSEADLDGHIHRPSSIRTLLTTPTHTVHRYWRKFDDAFMPVGGVLFLVTLAHLLKARVLISGMGKMTKETAKT